MWQRYRYTVGNYHRERAQRGIRNAGRHSWIVPIDDSQQTIIRTRSMQYTTRCVRRRRWMRDCLPMVGCPQKKWSGTDRSYCWIYVVPLWGSPVQESWRVVHTSVMKADWKWRLFACWLSFPLAADVLKKYGSFIPPISSRRLRMYLAVSVLL